MMSGRFGRFGKFGFMLSVPLMAAAVPLVGSMGKTEDIEGKTPGDRERTKTKIGEGLASWFQTHSPLNTFHTHTCSIFLKVGDPNKQIPVHQFISHINEDVMQSILMDSDRKDARMVGVEYIVTEKVFSKLPEDEKKFWHSKAYAAKSGLIVAPRLPWTAEHQLMEDLSPTYGKSVMFWDKESDQLPLGLPSLVVEPTKDGMVKGDLIKWRDNVLGINTEKERIHRRDIPDPSKVKGADLWEKEPFQLTVQKVKQ